MTEAQLFSDLELSRRLERAEAVSNARFVEARAKAFPESGATWIEVAGAYAMYDGASSPATQTFGLGLFETATAAHLQEIETFFRDRGAPVFHEVSPLAGLPVMTLLHERGYHPAELSSILYRLLRRGSDFGLSYNERVRARPIRDDEQELWSQIVAEGWRDVFPDTEFLLELVKVNTHREGMLSFLAELDGRPVAAAALSIVAGVALLAGACTIPEARNQGAQLALLDARLRHAAEQGCDLAMIGAAPGSASQRNAERHGFRVAYTRIKWGLPAGIPSCGPASRAEPPSRS